MANSQVMHGKQSQIQLEASLCYTRVSRKKSQSRYDADDWRHARGFCHISGTTDDQAIMGIQHRSLPIYGFQYHPESTGTPDGLKTIEGKFCQIVKWAEDETSASQ